jgi:hypothetical protein
MGMRPTDGDEKHAQRRMPGEYSADPGVFFRGASPWACGPPNGDEKHAQRRMPGEYGADPGVFFRGAVSPQMNTLNFCKLALTRLFRLRPLASAFGSRAHQTSARLALLVLISGSSLLAQISGVVTNGTTGKPQAGVVVTLVHPGENGMQTLGTSKTDADGKFKIDQPVPPPPALLEATYQDVQYNQVLPPNASPTGVQLSVYNSTSHFLAADLKEQHAVVIEPGQDGIRVNETYLVDNSGKTTILDPVKGSVQFYLPKEVQATTKITVQAPLGGQSSISSPPITRPPEKTSQPDIFKVSYPIKPGETDYEVSYVLPSSKTFAGKVLGKSPLVLITPEAVQLSGPDVKEDGLRQLGQKGPSARIYEVTAAAGASYEVGVEGTGAIQTSAAESEQNVDDGSPKPTAGNARVYERLPWVLGLTFSILGLGGVLLYRRSAA